MKEINDKINKNIMSFIIESMFMNTINFDVMTIMYVEDSKFCYSDKKWTVLTIRY